MTTPADPPAKTAMQYLIWAIEHIEKAGNRKAAHHARIALEALHQDNQATDTGEHAP